MGYPNYKSKILQYLIDNRGRSVSSSEIVRELSDLGLSNDRVAACINNAIKSKIDDASSHITVDVRGVAWTWDKVTKTTALPPSVPKVESTPPNGALVPPSAQRPARRSTLQAEGIGLFPREPRTFIEEGTALDGRIMVKDASSPRDKFYLSEQ
jgi:hypothetical protein